MARQLRVEFEGAFYHVTSRGNQREQIFWNNRDRERFNKEQRDTSHKKARKHISHG